MLEVPSGFCTHCPLPSSPVLVISLVQPWKGHMAAACVLDEIPVPCEEPLWALTARIGRPQATRDACTGAVGVDPLDNLRNQVAVQTLDARVAALHVRHRSCPGGDPAPLLSDPFDPTSFVRVGGDVGFSSASSSRLPRGTVRQNLTTPAFRGVSSVSFARSGLMTSTVSRVGGAVVVGPSGNSGSFRVAQPGFFV